MMGNRAAYMELLAGELDPNADMVEIDDGSEVARPGHSPRHRSPQPDLHNPDERQRHAARSRPLGVRRETGRERTMRVPVP